MYHNLISFSVSKVEAWNILCFLRGSLTCGKHLVPHFARYTRQFELIEASYSAGDEKPKERSAYLV